MKVKFYDPALRWIKTGRLRALTSHRPPESLSVPLSEAVEANVSTLRHGEKASSLFLLSGFSRRFDFCLCVCVFLFCVSSFKLEFLAGVSASLNVLKL